MANEPTGPSVSPESVPVAARTADETAAAASSAEASIAASPDEGGPLLTPEFTAKLEALGVVSRKLLAGRMHGERRSPRRGESLEFADHRPYSPGDDLRRLDWNAYGRLERLFLKLFLAEEDLSLYLLLDGSKSMDFGRPHKFEQARRLVAALAYVGLVNMDRVSLSVWSGGKERFLTDLRGKSQTRRLFRFMEACWPGGRMVLEEAVRRFLLRRKRPGVLVLVSDFLAPEGYEEPLRLCVARRMETFALHVLSPEEVEPQPTGDVKLLDSETGDAVDITVSPRLYDAYAKTLRGYCAGLREFCTRRGISYLFTSTEVPVERLVLHYLRRSRLLH